MSNIIFVVETGGGYWGHDVLGVYSTFELAKKACERDSELRDYEPVKQGIVWRDNPGSDGGWVGVVDEGYANSYHYTVKGYVLDE